MTTDTHPSSRAATSFLFGMVGAAAVEGLRTYKIATLQPVLFHWPYVLLSITFVVLGGVFSVAWGDDHPLKSVYIGASLPVVLSAWASA